MVRMLVGQRQQEFIVHKKLLCASSDFFRYSLETVESAPSSPGSELPAAHRAQHDKVLWLSEECPEMMELFMLWLYQRSQFQILLEDMIASVTQERRPTNKTKTQASRRILHWNLVKLHIFAASIHIPDLQDIAMDAIQDFYLKCDWDVSTKLVKFLYQECTKEESFRLRKWAVAMLAWTLCNGGSDPVTYNELLFDLPGLWTDYAKHMDRTVDSKADVRIKNPQLRLPRNKLRNEERQFGFRMCSFHSHRSRVGEGRCPHALEYEPEESRDASPEPLLLETESSSPEPCPRLHRLESNASSMWTVPESADET